MMRRIALPAVCVCGVLAAASASAEPAFMTDWRISGSNTLRFEHYDTDGDPFSSPYPFSGGQHYNEFNINLFRRDSPWSLWRGQISGVINSSDYRSPETGLVPERLSLLREDGNAAVPYRVELGDYFAFMSFRTLQRSLKGAQLELQPHVDAAGRRHSVLLLAGANQRSWKDFQLADDVSTGASWLVEDPVLRGTWGVNVLHNHRQADPARGGLQRNQWLWSALGAFDRTLAGNDLNLEAELAFLTGDHDGRTTAASGQDRAGLGGFVQLRGATIGTPLRYRLRYERNDEDFRPANAVITPDRESAEAHAAWRFASGLDLRGRAQYYEDRFQSANPLETKIVGVALSGPVPGRFAGLTTTSIDAFTLSSEDAAGGVDRDTRSLRVSVTRPLPAGWHARMGLFWQATHDATAGGFTLVTRQVSLAADHRIAFAGFTGSVSPGVVLRRITGGTLASDEIFPTLALDLARGAHRGGISLGYQIQDRSAFGIADIETFSAGANYQYARGANLFGVDVNVFKRDSRPGADTDAYRVSLYWTHHFDKPARPRATVFATPLAADTGFATRSGALALAELRPGLSPDAVRARLERAGLGGGTRVVIGVHLYEARLLPGIDQRQRLALDYAAGALDRAALIIDFDDIGSRDTAAQTFERVRRELIERHGRPDTFVERGEFSAGLVDDVSAGRFTRLMEWRLPGAVLRFGIPRRLDRQIRMEVQVARRFPDAADAFWSIEEVR